MTTVFISYRRGETAGEARALFNELSARLGKDSVFMDVDNIALGRDFRQVLQERLASCDLVLVMIGKGWVDVKNAAGGSRLEDPTDFVHLEIEVALKRNIPVTPVLVQGAQMPAAAQLPGDIKDFAYRNAFELSHSRWESDVAEILKRLDLATQQSLGSNRKTDTSVEKSPVDERLAQVPFAGTGVPAALERTRKPWLAAVVATAVAIAAAAGGLIYYRTVVEDNAKIEQARAESAKVKADAEAAVAAMKAESDKFRADAEVARARGDAEAAKARVEAEAAAKARADAEAAKAKSADVRAEKDRLAAPKAEGNRPPPKEPDRAGTTPPPSARSTDNVASLLKQAKALAKGDGVPQNLEESFKLYRKAAELGDAGAQWYVGYLFQYGRGVPKDEVEAVKWYRKAAVQGEMNAQFGLGLAYEQGRGVSTDRAESAKWFGMAAPSFRMAAERGDAQAQYILANMYLTGRGVQRNEPEAVIWYRKAAQAGHPGARRELQGRNLTW